jgi:hypothetical protein
MFYKILLLAGLLVAVNQQNNVQPEKLFTKADAERIMGEPLRLTNNTPSSTPQAASHLYGYEAVAKVATGRPGAIYFLFEQYHDEAEAIKRYVGTRDANKPMGIEELPGLSDGAYYHTDGQHFYFIMVRKGKYVFNIKVNKITQTTSLAEFKKTAKNITAALPGR